MLPSQQLNQIFAYLPLSDLATCSRVCKRWNEVLIAEDSVVWRKAVKRMVPDAALQDARLLAELPTWKSRARAWAYAWNPLDASRNNYVRPNGFTVHRQPVAQSTDGIRGKRPIRMDRDAVHAFDFTWDGPLGTVAVLGLATRHAALHCTGYLPLLGADDQSWGWNLVDGTLVHDGRVLAQSYPRQPNPPKYESGERVRLVLDGHTRQAYFERPEGVFLGVAFSDLPPVPLYPACCAVYGNTEVTMVYVGAPLVG